MTYAERGPEDGAEINIWAYKGEQETRENCVMTAFMMLYSSPNIIGAIKSRWIR
jgi:hypothetical protein